MKHLTLLLLLLLLCSVLFYGQKEVVYEGFYSKGFEMSMFNILEKDSLHESYGYVVFDKTVQEIDSLKKFTNGDFPDFRNGIYVKFKAVYKKEKVLHPAYSYKLEVKEIIKIDTARTKYGYIAAKIKENGFYSYKKYKIRMPDVLDEGKLYTFTAEKNGYSYKLTLIRTGITTQYEYSIYKQNHREILHTGMAELDVNDLLYSEQIRRTGEGYKLRFEDIQERYKYGDGFFFLIPESKDDKGRILTLIYDYDAKKNIILVEQTN